MSEVEYFCIGWDGISTYITSLTFNYNINYTYRNGIQSYIILVLFIYYYSIY